MSSDTEGISTVSKLIRVTIILVLIIVVAFVLVSPEKLIQAVSNIYETGVVNNILNKDNNAAARLQQVKDNFEKINENIQQCSEINDDECICEIFPNFPSTFDKAYLEFNNDGGEMSLKTNQNGNLYDESTKKAIWAEMSQVIILYPENQDSVEFISCSYKSDLFINFAEANTFPLTSPCNSPTSSYHGNYNQLISKYFFKYDSTELQMILGKPVLNEQQQFQRLNEKIKEMPKCIDNRQKAIKQFNELVISAFFREPVGSEITIILEKDFSIYFEENLLTLYYKGEKIKETVSTFWSNVKLYNEVDYDIISCPNSELNEHLENGDKLITKWEGQDLCISLSN